MTVTDSDLRSVVALNLRQLIEDHNMRHADVAAGMAARGFGWTTNRVAQTVTLRRMPKLDELAGLCAVFGVPLAELLKGADDVIAALGLADRERPDGA